jgi:hypothetical protein
MKITVITKAIGDTAHSWAQVIIRRFGVKKVNKKENTEKKIINN